MPLPKYVLARKRLWFRLYEPGYRVIGNDAAIAYLSFLYKTFAYLYAYDFNVSGLRKATKAQGAFEIAFKL